MQRRWRGWLAYGRGCSFFLLFPFLFFFPFHFHPSSLRDLLLSTDPFPHLFPFLRHPLSSYVYRAHFLHSLNPSLPRSHYPFIRVFHSSDLIFFDTLLTWTRGNNSSKILKLFIFAQGSALVQFLRKNLSKHEPCRFLFHKLLKFQENT